MSNLIIPANHQSAPKDTDLTKAIQTAACEIHSGAFRPELHENVFGKKEDDFFNVGITGTLAQHPRVQDALRTLETQVQDKTSAEYQEKLEMLHELNVMYAEADKWEGQERWQGKTNREQRLVNLMQPKQFIEKLQLAKISAAVVPLTHFDYRADAAGIIRLCEVESSEAKVCLGKRVIMGVVGLYANIRGEYRRIEKLQVPIGPEWTLMRFDEYNVPINEEFHGWRSAVLALIREGVITEAQADKAFGKPIENAASSFYRQQLAEYRNRK